MYNVHVDVHAYTYARVFVYVDMRARVYVGVFAYVSEYAAYQHVPTHAPTTKPYLSPPPAY